MAGEILAKMQALEKVVGKEMIAQASIPQMKKPRIQGLMSATRATAIRNAGVNARNTRLTRNARN